MSADVTKDTIAIEEITEMTHMTKLSDTCCINIIDTVGDSNHTEAHLLVLSPVHKCLEPSLCNAPKLFEHHINLIQNQHYCFVLKLFLKCQERRRSVYFQ